MIKELSEFGKKIREKNSVNKIFHDALKEETIGILLTLKKDGSFISLNAIDKKKTMAHAIQRTSGKEPRLLIDNIGYTLALYNTEGAKYKNEIKKIGESKAKEKMNIDALEKNNLFINKLFEYKTIKKIEPVIKFYTSNKQNGISKITQKYLNEHIEKEDRDSNIAFYILGDEKYVHEHESVYEEIIKKYERHQDSILTESKRKCSICGSDKYPVGNYSHFPIRNVPGDKEPAGGRKLISYNDNPFESYGMVRNENCNMCTQCAKTYVEGLNWLLSAGSKKKNEKGKEYTDYSNRKKFGSDTAMVFWTKENRQVKEIDLFDEPDEGEIARLVESVANAKESTSRMVDPDQFYAFTLSGAAARIAVRDWIQLSLPDLKQSIAGWFKDIVIVKYDRDRKEVNPYHSSLYLLAGSCQRKVGNNKKDSKDVTFSRVSAILWNAALKGNSLPVWILSSVLKRVRVDEEGVSPERASLIKLILNRNNKGGTMLQKSLDSENVNTAYICGRLFAVMESIQHAALGKTNAGIRERFFSFASTNPSSAFGRLCKMSQNHLSKLKNEKPGFAVILDKELQDLFGYINDFPVVFDLEDQGRFAIGYYHQKQSIFSKAKDKPELLEAIDESLPEGK